MSRIETIGDCTLYLGDCRDKDVGQLKARKAWGKSPIKKVVSCNKCNWTWRPFTGFQNESCPKCGEIKRVSDRKYTRKLEDLSILKGVVRKKTSTDWEKTYRDRARLLVGRGQLVCVKCGCDDVRLLEINHKFGGGGKEFKELGNKFYRLISKMERGVDDLELLCRPCNSVHALELKYGALPFQVKWGQSDGLA